ncbi:hypothetical protein BCR42DRAFT_412818 [Absidia repens]|uniref:Nucleotide-diphospho-sugar transferase n=1 Tax=Absidia repens TaxID=90262 RepID=A0A1X2IK49_9FUNG|nr:hypothetical protein BCR42DRAFT_412818 [Absidia repens]
MAARFTLASGLTNNKYCNYIASFSVRSLSTLALLTVTISLCFIYSSSGPNYLTSNMDGFLFAQNKTHLLSTAKYDCLYCERPPIYGYTQEQLFDACLDSGVVPEYYMSIILPSRPVEYSAEHYTRLQNTIDSTFLLAEKSKTLMELVLVEWNPEPQRRPLRDTYRFRRSDYLTYRIITVPRKIHQSLQQPERAAMYEYEAKNVGIRFARGEFVLTVNNDVIWTPNMINAIASRSWRKGMFYTQSQNTTSISAESDPLAVQIPNFSTDDELNRVCGHHNNFAKGSFKMGNLVDMDTENYSKMTRNAGDFTLADRESWRLTKGYRETGATTGADTELLLTAAWTLDLPIAFQPTTTFNCHQQLRSVQNTSLDTNVDIDGLKNKKVSYMNKSDQWGLQGRDLYKEGVQCEVFRGGLGM